MLSASMSKAPGPPIRSGHRNFPNWGQRKKFRRPSYDFGLGGRIKSGTAELNSGQMPLIPPAPPPHPRWGLKCPPLQTLNWMLCSSNHKIMAIPLYTNRKKVFQRDSSPYK